MRHTTLGDWFVERYESKMMGVAYTAFAFGFYILYLSAMFSAISKVAAPLARRPDRHDVGRSVWVIQS